MLSDSSFPLWIGVSDSDSLSMKQSVSPDRETAGDSTWKKIYIGSNILLSGNTEHTEEL